MMEKDNNRIKKWEQDLKERVRVSVWGQIRILIRWLVLALIVGTIVGLLSTVFGKGIVYVTELRTAYPWLLYGLPLAGLGIVRIYSWEQEHEKSSTNMVLDAIHAKREIPVKTAPLIFISTILTHLFGGSVGREGAALQLGGSMGNFLGKCFRMDENDKRVMIMCGMSAAFSALFGTPMAAAIFSMEVVSVGIMHYAALVPCVVASYIGGGIAGFFGLSGEHFLIHGIPAFTLFPAGKILLLGVCCAAVSVLFCGILHKVKVIFHQYLPNAFFRAFVAGILIIVLTGALGTRDYLGSGMQLAERAVEGEVLWYAFLLKMLFTAITLGGGFKGGEIVPTLCVGATFGCMMGQLLQLSPSLAAACGMVALFCGVTNSPISSLLLGFELFGFEGAPFLLLVIAVSYMQSGYYGLYHSQKIMYSKVKTQFINRSVKE